jgi:RNA polymerase-binding protein DksA
MAEKYRRLKSEGSAPRKTISPAERNVAAKKTLLSMKERLLAEGLGKSLPAGLVRSFDIGDEGDRADNEATNEVTILISARDKEKLLAIEGALEKIQEGTYGECGECGDEIGGGRQKVMPLAQLCVTCQSKIEKETEHQKFARDEMRDQELMSEASMGEKD